MSDLHIITKSDDSHLLMDGEKIISEHKTNAKAWRALDLMTNELINKNEERADWFNKKVLDD